MLKIGTITLVLISFLVFLAYLFTSAPGLGLIDSGELTAVTHSLGIAHPTGYPLYTLIGRLFSLMPFGDVARRMVIFSNLCMAIACGFLLWTAAEILRKCFRFSVLQSALLAGAAVLAFAFSLTPWQTAAYAEVYPLTLLLVSVLYAIGVRLLLEDKPNTRLWLAYGFIFGLALGNHLTVLWTSPLGLVALWRNFGLTREALRPLLATVSVGILGATIILYLPIRSHLNPPLDWGNPETLNLLWRHLTGWQYQVWMFQEGMIGRIGDYFSGLPEDMGWGGIALAVLGVIGLAGRAPRLLAALILVWLVAILYNVNYDIPDIAPYFLPAHAALCLIGAGGAALLWHFVRAKSVAVRIALCVLLIVPAALGAITHRAQTDRSTDRFAVSLVSEVLRTLPPNAVALHALWDVQSPAIYLQEVERYRTDVVLIDIHLMRRRWYVEQLFRHHPEVTAGCERERDRFLKELVPFDAGKPFNGAAIEQAFVALHDSIISKNLSRRPVYLRFAREAGHPGIGARLPATPGAFFYRLGMQRSEEELLDVEKICGGRTQFNDREKYLLTAVREILYQRHVTQRISGDPDRVALQLRLLDSILR